MAKIGYARVSTKNQCDDSQVDELTAYGCDKLFIDHGVSGKHAARPELDAALEYMRQGDVLVITRLSRAMRSLKHLLALAEELRERGIGLVVLKQQSTRPHPGRLVSTSSPASTSSSANSSWRARTRAWPQREPAAV